MKGEEFEKAVEVWADHEVESAPEIQPTAEMYRLVRARAGREQPLPVYSRWAKMGAAVASLIVMAVLYTVLFQPSIVFGPPSGQEVALVGQREGFGGEKGIVFRGTQTTPDKGSGKGGPVYFERLELHFQKQGSSVVEAIDLRATQAEMVSLTPADNYRVLLQPGADCHVGVFELISAGVLIRLFPNETYTEDQNPLREGRAYHLPSDPRWFYLGHGLGTERLYVVASVEPIQGLGDLYEAYDEADDGPDQRELLSRLVEMLDTISDNRSEEAAGWVLAFEHR